MNLAGLDDVALTSLGLSAFCRLEEVRKKKKDEKRKPAPLGKPRKDLTVRLIACYNILEGQVPRYTELAKEGPSLTVRVLLCRVSGWCSATSCMW